MLQSYITIKSLNKTIIVMTLVNFPVHEYVCHYKYPFCAFIKYFIQNRTFYKILPLLIFRTLLGTYLNNK